MAPEPRRGGAILSGDLLGRDDQDSGPAADFPAPAPDGNGIPVGFKTQQQWLNIVKTNGCGNCHQSATTRRATIPDGARPLRYLAWRRGCSVCSPGRPGTDMVNFITQVTTPDGGHLTGARRLDRPHQGRRAAERSRRARSASSATSWSRCETGSDPKHYLHDLTTDRQAQSDRQRLRPDLRRRPSCRATTCRCSTRSTTPRGRS